MSKADSLRQPSLRRRLESVLLDRAVELDVIGLRTTIVFQIAREGRAPLELPFIVDSGSSISMVSLEAAQSRGLKVPPPEAEVELPATTAEGRSTLRVRPGRIRVWWDASCRGYPFDWPVLFRVNAPPGVPAILGLGGIIKTCRWTFDGDFSYAAPFGHLMLEDIR